MITIDKVRIENFQSHENTELVFNDGLNVIIGPSDQGKSAILRAIKWVLYNEPRGNEFIRQGTNAARVRLELSNGFAILRERTPSKNRYVLTNPDGEESIFEGFGNEVPLEVIKAHGIPKVVLDTDIKSSLNIGEQLEGSFLLSESGALRAKAIGRLTGLHIIDKSIRDSSADLRRENQTHDRINDELKEIKEKLEEYKELETLEKKLAESENVINRLENNIKRLEKLETLEDIFHTVKNESENLESNLLKLSMLDECYAYIKSGELLQNRLIFLESMLKRLKNIYSAVSDMEKVLKETYMVNEGIEIIEEASRKLAGYQRLKKLGTRLNGIIDELDRSTKILDGSEIIEGIDKISDQIGTDNSKLIRLTVAKEKLNLFNKEIDRINAILTQADNAMETGRIIEAIEQSIKSVIRLESVRENIRLCENNIREGNKFIENNKKEMKNFLKEYTVLLKQKGRCPLCESVIGDEKLDNIIKHYEEVH